MKIKALVLILIVIPVFTCFAQNNYIIDISPDGKNLKIYPPTEIQNGIVLYINQYGEPGFEVQSEAEYRWSEYRDATEGLPEEINGIRFSYYNNLDHNGFLESIGDISLEYYERMPGEAWSGRLHYINDIEITYHDNMQGPPKQGKIKTIEGINLDYYYGFDNEGKLSRAGKYRIYYNQEDNRSGKSGRPDAIEGHDPRLTIIMRFAFSQINSKKM